MEKYHIQLTDNEAALVEAIDLRSDHRNHHEGHTAWLNNQSPILELLRSLDTRKAIPQERLNYWSDPSYRTGRIKASRKGIFERNGCTGNDIYTHPHFLEHLRYFLFGCELPDAVIDEFETQVGDPRWVSGSDSIEIGKFARTLVRKYDLDRSQAPEEFFKLCLDLGLGRNTSERVMASVKQVR